MPLDFNALDEPIKHAAASLSESRARQQPPPPDLLFHYTSASGLRGILTSSRLWATHYRFLNDSSEIAYGVSLFEKLVKEKQKQNSSLDPVVAEFLNRTLQTVNSFDGMLDCYIACFCERDDLLNQWRTYSGSGGGYALGLNSREIGRRWGQLERSQHFMLRRVEYQPTVQIQLLAEVIDLATGVLRTHTQGLSIEEANAAIAACCHFVRVQSADYLLTFKHPAFEIEREWRLCHIVMPSERDHIEFREGPFGLTPYVCLDITPMAGVHHNKLPVARITHGPSTNPDNARLALEKLLQKLNYAFVEVGGSTLPVRVGA